jgi:hypothetical protein
VDLLVDLADVQSVELKMTVPARQRSALAGIGLDVLRGRLREVFFFDTPELTLFRHGLALRARRTQRSDDDLLVKLRPVVPAELPAGVRSSPDLKIEMDVTRDTSVVSASLRSRRPAGAVRAVLAGERALERLLTKQQRSLFEAHRPDGVTWSDLVTLGPALVVVLRAMPPAFGRRLTIEQWHYPGEVPLVELSTQSNPAEVRQLVADSIAFLGRHDLHATGPQEPKTRTALEFHAARAAGPVAAPVTAQG